MMKPLPVILSTLLFVLAGAGISSTASATVTGDNPCPSQTQFPWYGDSAGTSQMIPSVTAGSSETYPSTVLAPSNTTLYPGKRPVVVIQHGRNGDRCSLWWVAQYLAGHGFVAEIHAAPPDPDQGTAFLNAYDASKSAIAFMNSPANPAGAVSDMNRLGFMGHSLGSAVTSLIQGDPAMGIKAIVAYDNLRRYLAGDPGGSNQECDDPESVQVTPLVPAIGLAKDEPCNSAPGNTSPDIKQFGQQYWRSVGQPSMETVMRGFVHGDFGKSGDETQHKDLAYYTGAWFQRWLQGDTSQDAVLLSQTVNGRPAADVLSTHYLSAACLPGRVDTTNFASWISADPVEPEPMAGCEKPTVPSDVAPATGSPGRFTSPRFTGISNLGATVDLFTNPDCSGTPAGSGSGKAFNGNGITLNVAKKSTTNVYARATNPVTNLASACSAEPATYRQADPVLTGLKIKGPGRFRAGTKVNLRIYLHNRSQADAGATRIRMTSSNPRVKPHRQVAVMKGVEGGKTAVVHVSVRASRTAHGKVRITASHAGMKKSVTLRIKAPK